MLKLISGALFCAIFAGAAWAQDREAVAAGSALYREKCIDCHGPGLVPSGAGADLRELRASDRAKFDKTMKEGRNQMPSWDGQLSDAEFDQLWAYVRSRAND